MFWMFFCDGHSRKNRNRMKSIVVLILYLVSNVYCESIIDGPKSVTLKSGENATLTCTITSDATLLYWRANSKYLTLPDRWRKAGQIGNQLFLNITNVSLPISGGYSCVVKNKGQVRPEESNTAFVLINSGCSNGMIKCGLVKKCIPQKDLCNNKNDCGDLWDEKVNCKPPTKLGIRMIYFYGYTRLQIKYFTFNSWKKNYTTVVQVWKSEKLIIKKESYPTNDQIYQSVFVDGVQNGTTYLVSLQAVNIVGIPSEPTYQNVTVPKASLPEVPSLLDVHHIDYDGIYVELYIYQGPIFNYTTTFKISDKSGQKVANDVVLINSKVVAKIGLGKLKNNTEYFITVESSNFVGKCKRPLKVNYTIPRMIAPGPVQNMTVKVRTTYSDSVSVNVYYDRPVDDGGSEDLQGTIKKCKVDSAGKLNDCEKQATYLGFEKSNYDIFDLPFGTKFYFEIYMRSKVYQKGQSSSIFYTTQEKEQDHEGGLLYGQKIAIYVSVGCAGCSLVLSLIVYVGRQWLRDRQNVPYARQT